MALLAVDAVSLLGSKLPCGANGESSTAGEATVSENSSFLIHGNVITLYSGFETLENFGIFPISMISLRKKDGFSCHLLSFLHAVCLILCNSSPDHAC